jgi:hypothetical protein
MIELLDEVSVAQEVFPGSLICEAEQVPLTKRAWRRSGYIGMSRAPPLRSRKEAKGCSMECSAIPDAAWQNPANQLPNYLGYCNASPV